MLSLTDKHMQRNTPNAPAMEISLLLQAKETAVCYKKRGKKGKKNRNKHDNEEKTFLFLREKIFLKVAYDEH